MDEQDKTHIPEDPPVTIGDDEVERLLTDAQDMVDEIASTAGIDAGAKEHDRDSPFLDEKSDPLAGADNVQEVLSELNGLIGDDDAKSEEEASQPKTATVGAEETPTDQASDRDKNTATAASEARPDETAAVTSSTAPSGDLSSQADEPNTTSAEVAKDGGPDIEFDSELVVDSKADVSESTEKDVAQAEADGKHTAGVSGSRAKRIINKLLVASRTVVNRVILKGAAVSRTILGVLVVLDRPFAALSPSVKRHIGFVAVATVLMGLASLILPGMLEHNPYESIEP